MNWTNEARQTLKTLWHEGHSTATIGRHLGCSKNSVISRARRDDLPPRPSPVNKEFPELAPRRAEGMRLRGLGLGRQDIMRMAGITRSQYESAMRARPKERLVTSTLKPLPSLAASAPVPRVLPLLPPKSIQE